MNSENSWAKLSAYVGFAIKANKAALGIDKISAVKKPPYVILYDKSAGNDTMKKLLRLKEKGCEIFLSDDLLSITGKQGVKVIGICDLSLANAISNFYKENLNDRT